MNQGFRGRSIHFKNFLEMRNILSSTHINICAQKFHEIMLNFTTLMLSYTLFQWGKKKEKKEVCWSWLVWVELCPP